MLKIKTMKKFFTILIMSLFLSSNIYAGSEKSDQLIKLNYLFDELIKNNNNENADLIEREIWSVWNKHPSQKKLTNKLEFATKLMFQGRYDYALIIFTNIIEKDSSWPEAWNKRATLFFLMKEYEKSLTDIEKVLNLEPRHFGALSGRAKIYIERQQYQKAINDLKKVKKIYPTIRNNILIIELEKIMKGLSI
jgi:tetratricopeptide (TPR) repeat protein